jgi:hypothetical protein
VFNKSFASEFPHDNPELSEGTTWLSASVCGRPLAHSPGVLLRPAPPPPPARTRVLACAAAVTEERGPELCGAPNLLRPPRKVRERASGEPAQTGPFERFLSAMVEVALSRGATHVAAELPFILREGRLRPSALGASVTRALASRGYLDGAGGAASEAFRATQGAWLRALDGTSLDLSGCGAATLDQWGAQLLAVLLNGSSSGAEELRRGLRQRGVAAFGMRDAA